MKAMRLTRYLDMASERSRKHFAKVRRRPIKRYFRAVSERSRYYLAKIQGRQVINLLHIGKTGGTAVKTALSQAQPCARILLRLHPHPVRLCDIPKGEKVIFFLREPSRRFVSGFNTRQRQGRPRYDNPWEPRERIAFSRFHSANDLAVALSSHDADVRKAAEEAMRSIRHVRDSFYYWFVSDEYFTSRLDDVVFIGFQETLGMDFDRLKHLLGLPRDLRLPGDEVVAHRSPSAQPTTLSAEAKANLSRWYAMDLAFYSRCREIAATQSRGPDRAEHSSVVLQQPAREGSNPALLALDQEEHNRLR
jgi:hypothetical protein